MENIELAAILSEMATLLEIQGETNPFRIRAYRNAVYTIQESPDPIRKMVEAGEDLTELPAIGKDMASHITELVTTGKLSILEEVSKEVPRSLVELTKLPGVGPKKAVALLEAFGSVSGVLSASREEFRLQNILRNTLLPILGAGTLGAPVPETNVELCHTAAIPSVEENF